MSAKTDPRNKEIMIFVKDKLYPRSEARISVFDSAVQGGDAVWEGLRVYNGKIFALDLHLNRLHESAKSMAFTDIPSFTKIKTALFETLKANGMKDKAHIRLTLTRGEKETSGMSPEFNKSGSCLIVLAEWKLPVYPASGIKLITSSIRRNPPQCIDSKIHHNNLINNILAKIQANLARVDDAVMLDLNGFVSETNATNLFMLKDGKLFTPHADCCLPGVTRGIVIGLAHKNKIPVAEKNISINEFYNADEVFTTGTMGELSPVLEIDGRKIENKHRKNITKIFQKLYSSLTATQGEELPF